MRTVRSTDILLGVAAKAGLDITDGGIAALQRPTILPWIENLSDYLARLWDLYPWPELLTVEQRYFYEGPWETGATVAAEATVYHESAYWTAKQSTTQEPGGAHWEELTDAPAYYLPFSPQFYGTMGTVISVQSHDPRKYGLSFGILHRHLLDGEGFHIPADIESVWVTWKTRYPEFSMHESRAYAKGDGVYAATTGRFYTADQDTPGTEILGAAPYWTEYFIPATFRRYLTLKVFAQWLRSEKRLDEAAIASNQAEKAIDEQIYKLLNDSDQARTVRFNK